MTLPTQLVIRTLLYEPTREMYGLEICAAAHTYGSVVGHPSLCAWAHALLSNMHLWAGRSKKRSWSHPKLWRQHLPALLEPGCTQFEPGHSRSWALEPRSLQTSALLPVSLTAPASMH